MPGSIAGGKAAAATNKDKYGSDFYARIGRLGGKTKTTKPKGFAARKDIAISAGRVGGLKSKRGKSLTNVTHTVKQHPKAGTVDTRSNQKTYHFPKPKSESIKLPPHDGKTTTYHIKSVTQLDDEMSQSKKQSLLGKLFRGGK